MHRVVEGVVLRETDTKEADKILTVLTKTEGKITVIARGARRKNSRIAAAAQLLAYSEMTLFERGKWSMLDEAETKELFRGVRQDIVLLSLGSYFAEMAEALTQEDMPAPEILSLLLNALYALGALHKDPAAVKAAYELRLMCLSGYEPLLGECVLCGAAEPAEPMLDVVQGVLHCKDCRSGTRGLSMPLCGASLAAMRYAASCDAKKLYAYSLDGAAQKRMSDACEAFAAAQMERSFQTLSFYKQISGDAVVGK